MENYIDVGGGKIWTCINGNDNGPTVLLCNGGPGCCDYLAPVSQMLEQDYRVIRFEQRGCGRSVRDGKYDLETAVSDIEKIRKYYSVSKWIVGGHSWGANLALVYALKYSSCVDALLYIAGNGIQNDRHWSEEYHSNKSKKGETVPAMAYEFNNDVNVMGNATLRAFGRMPGLYKSIAELDIKTLFVVAENDIRPSWPVEQLCNLMPNTSYVRINKAEHFIWLFNSVELEQELLSFLKSIQDRCSS